jgi:hypothetical protein
MDVSWCFKKAEAKRLWGEDGVLVARDFLTSNGKTVKQFGCFGSHALLLEHIWGEHQRGNAVSLYEVIRYNTPCKLYFDVEWVSPKGAAEQLGLGAILACIDSVLRELVADDAKRECRVLEGGRALPCGRQKHSYHLVYPHIAFMNNTFAMKRVALLAHRQAGLLAGCGKNPIDLSVYTRDRLFRAPLCCKADDPSRTPLLPHGVSACASSDLLSFLVSNPAPGVIRIGKTIVGPAAPKSLPKARVVRRRDNGCRELFFSGFHLDVQKLESKLQSILREHGGMGNVRFDSLSEHLAFPILLFRIQHGVSGREEPCLAHGLFAKVTHRNDNQLLWVDNNFTVVVICPHQGKCSQKRYKLCRLTPSFFAL